MKKLLIIFYLLLPLFSIAQDFASLKKHADEFYKKGKYKKAAPLYAKAIELVVTYQEKVKDGDWEQLSVATGDTESKLNGQQKPQYPHIKYGADGEVLKEKIKRLKAENINCIFTFRTYGGNVVSSYLIIAPGSKAAVDVGSSRDRKYLIWANKDSVFMQPYDNFNVYLPVCIQNQQIIDICQNKYEQMMKDEILPVRGFSEPNVFVFNFYQNKDSYIIKEFDDNALTDPLKHMYMGLDTARNFYFKKNRQNYAKNHVAIIGQLALLLAKEANETFPRKPY